MELLLVEDESGIRDALSSFLRMQGIEVRAAAGIGEALAALEEEQFCCLVSDLHLPDGNGCELIDRFLECSPGGRALLSTANPPREIDAWLLGRKSLQCM